MVCNGPSVAVRVRSRFHDVRGRSLLRSRLWLPRLLWLLRLLQGLGVRLLWLRFKLLHTLLWIRMLTVQLWLLPLRIRLFALRTFVRERLRHLRVRKLLDLLSLSFTCSE